MLTKAVSILNFTFTEININTILNVLVIVFLLILILLVMHLTKVIKRGNPSNTVMNAAPLKIEGTLEQHQSMNGNDTELVAVITAALMAYLGDSISPDELVVRSIRQVGKRKPSSNYGFND